MNLRVFYRGQFTEWGYRFGLLKFQITFWVCLLFQIFIIAKHWIPCPSLSMEKKLAWAKTSTGENIGIQVCVSILLLYIWLFF